MLCDSQGLLSLVVGRLPLFLYSLLHYLIFKPKISSKRNLREDFDHAVLASD